MGILNSAKRFIVSSTKHLRFTQIQIKAIQRLSKGKDITKFLGTRGIYSLQLPNGKQINLISTNTITDNRLMRQGLFYNEKTSKMVWMELCKRARTVVDVGANLGQFVLLAMKNNEHLKIFAFEPFPDNLTGLKANLNENEDSEKHVVVLDIALSNKKGLEILYYCKGDIYTPSLTGGAYTNASIEVKVDTMDNVIPGKIDLIKMDIEGAEPMVLQGMTRILASDEPVILIEILKARRAEIIEEIMAQYHYLYYYIDENKGLIPTNTLNRRQGQNHNYLMVPASKKEWLPKTLLAAE